MSQPKRDVLIGLMGYTHNNSWVPRILEHLHKDMGQNCIHFNVEQCRDMLSPLESEKVLKYKKPYPLSLAIKGYNEIDKTPVDILIMEESFMWFENDLKIPVLYRHTETQMPLTVKYPTHVLYKNPEMNDFCHSMDPWGWKQILWKQNLFPAAHPPFWVNEVEKDVQCSFMGAPSDMFDRKRDYLWRIMQRDHWRIVDHIESGHYCSTYTDLGDEGISHRIYNEMMSRSRHTILTAFNGVWVGRRVFEALACKTIPIIWIENDECERCYRALKFIPYPERNHNCYFYRTPSELPALAKREYDPQMAARGYDMFMSNHTFYHRAHEILDLIHRTCQRVQVKVPPFEGLIDKHLYKASTSRTKSTT